MAVKLRVVGYALTFMAGTLFSGGAALAATNYIQALHESSNVALNGKTIARPDALVFGGTTYVQLYSIEQALKQIGIKPGWDGKTFSMQSTSSSNASTSDTAGLSGGSSDNLTVYSDVGHSMINVVVANDRVAILGSNASINMVTSAVQNAIKVMNDNAAALAKDSPTDPNLQKLQSDSINAMKQLVSIYTELNTAIQTGDTSLLDQAVNALPSAKQQLATALAEYQAYQNSITPTVSNTTSGNTTSTTNNTSTNTIG